jgi:DNA-binding response OmpR family regulator
MAIRILVVDDATFIRDMMKKTLREKLPGVEVFDAPDGNRALAVMKTQKIDLILSDWEMPSMTGEEFLREIRGNELYSKIPFIMVSSRGERDHVVTAVKAGVSDYITKPFTPDELIRKTLKQLQKIGKNPRNLSPKVGKTQGMERASIDVLTGSAAKPDSSASLLTGGAKKDEVRKPVPHTPGGALLAASASTSSAAAKPAAKAKSKTKGRAQLRFPNNISACVIREVSLQAMSGLMPRGDNLPTVFDQAVVDIETDDGKNVARVNGYVHSIIAGEEKMDTNIVKIVIRFVDNDPDKFEFLSKYISKV